MGEELRRKDDFKEEKEVLMYLANAWNKFQAMYREHPSELKDFTDGIHQCQRIIGMRIARNYMPELFPIKIEETKLTYEAMKKKENNQPDDSHDHDELTDEEKVSKKCEEDPLMKFATEYSARLTELYKSSR